MIFRVVETEHMPRVVGGNTERFCSKLKSCKGFWKPNFEPMPSVSATCVVSSLFNLGRHNFGAQHAVIPGRVRSMNGVGQWPDFKWRVFCGLRKLSCQYPFGQ
jgi:hypothetical protein